jgi:hypothetical protein
MRSKGTQRKAHQVSEQLIMWLNLPESRIGLGQRPPRPSLQIIGFPSKIPSNVASKRRRRRNPPAPDPSPV